MITKYSSEVFLRLISCTELYCSPIFNSVKNIHEGSFQKTLQISKSAEKNTESFQNSILSSVNLNPKGQRGLRLLKPLPTTVSLLLLKKLCFTFYVYVLVLLAVFLSPAGSKVFVRL